MREECIVHDVKDGLAYVSLSRSDACGGCKACVFGKSKMRVVPAIKEVDCRVGDKVTVELPENEIKPAFLIFLVPILALFAGFFVGWLLKSEIAQVVCALSFCAISLFPIYILDKKFRKRKYMPVVVELIHSAQDIKENV